MIFKALMPNVHVDGVDGQHLSSIGLQKMDLTLNSLHGVQKTLASSRLSPAVRFTKVFFLQPVA